MNHIVNEILTFRELILETKHLQRVDGLQLQFQLSIEESIQNGTV